MRIINNLIAKILIVFMMGLGLSNLSFGADTSGLFRVDSRTTNSHRVYFHRGDTVDIDLVGDGSTDLDLYVYDQYGNLCARRNGPYDEEEMSLDVYESGYFSVRVVNVGWDYNDYSLSLEVY